jgi:hypothetical protein
LWLGLVFVEEAFEEGDGVEEVVIEQAQEVDVVEVLLAKEAVEVISAMHANLTGIDPNPVFR